MKKCEPWAVAAVYLMQSDSGKEHYTDIVNYIVDTELTELHEKGVAISRTVTDRINQKVVDGHAVFKSDGNGYYSLDDEGTLRKNEDIQGVIKCLKDNNLKVTLVAHEEKEKKPIKEDVIPVDNDDKLTDEARKLSEETRKLSDEARKLSDETLRLSEETVKLSDENKKLREEIKQLRGENQKIKDKLQSIKQLCE